MKAEKEEQGEEEPPWERGGGAERPMLLKPKRLQRSGNAALPPDTVGGAARTGNVAIIVLLSLSSPVSLCVALSAPVKARCCRIVRSQPDLRGVFLLMLPSHSVSLHKTNLRQSVKNFFFFLNKKIALFIFWFKTFELSHLRNVESSQNFCLAASMKYSATMKKSNSRNMCNILWLIDAESNYLLLDMKKNMKLSQYIRVHFGSDILIFVYYF